MVRRGSKDEHQKGMMCVKAIGLRAQNALSNLGSIVNTRGGLDLCDHFISTRTFTLILNKIIICTPNAMTRYKRGKYLGIICGISLVPHNIVMNLNNIMNANGYGHDLDLLIVLHVSCPTRSRCQEGKYPNDTRLPYN